MADERRIPLKHTLVMDQRENLALTGITDVISFDEEVVVAESEKGVIVVKGINLHVKRLNLDNGELDIEGEMSSITYEDAGGPIKGHGSFLGRIFR